MYSMREDDGHNVFVVYKTIGLSSCRTSGCIPTKGFNLRLFILLFLKQDLRFHPKGLAVESPFYDKPVVLI